MPAMPNEPPSCRKKLYSPVPCASSADDSSASVIVVNGTNMKPSPTPRSISGQKKSDAPLSPVISDRPGRGREQGRADRDEQARVEPRREAPHHEHRQRR